MLCQKGAQFKKGQFMRNGLRLTVLAALLCSSAPVLAGEEPLYQPAPEWVEPVALERGTTAEDPVVLIADAQKRLDGSKVWDYRDFAYRIDSPDVLNSGGTLSASWIPDKGDLIINGVTILRGDQEIDVLAQGARFTVLRRERALERREINGVLTATLAVPGLRVGDVVRVAYTTVQSDQALGNEVQSVDALPAAPLEVGFARLRVSWPEDAPIRWRAGPDVELVDPVEQDGYKVLDVALPLAKRKEMPNDAPWRFRRAPLLQLGSFETWQQVSQALAPHFRSEGTISPDGEIAQRISAIRKATKDPLTRAAMALQTVQDDISYLANGLDGGNYLPQSPEETWALRYGDCKAKSFLLVAMLREMGIAADVVVVHSSAGDAAPEMLPMPADFDHMIVRARIGGEDYWLDGTASGTRLSNIGEVPAFHYALPITAPGSDLVPMVQRPLTVPDRALTLTIDQSAGIDLPALYSATIDLSGVLAASVRPWVSETSETSREEFAKSQVAAVIGANQLIDYTISYNDDAGSARLTANGILTPAWQFQRGTARQYLPALPASDLSFSPDRARRDWREIPVQMGGPATFRTDLKVVLPDRGEGFELRGREVVDTSIAGIRIKRDARIEKGVVHVTEEAATTLTEIAPADVAAEKGKAARLNAGKLSLHAPQGVKRSWDLVGGIGSERLAGLESAYARLIAKDIDDVTPYLLRSDFRASVLDWDGALADLHDALEVEPTATAYLARAYYNTELGRPEEALADVRAAFDLDPTPTNAIEEAGALAELGRFDEALELLEIYEEDAESYVSVLFSKAEVMGLAGNAAGGLSVLEGLLAERPGDPDVLNGICWQMGAWNLKPDQMLAECTKAVESANWSPPVLDSRAMAYFRLGKYAESLADYNAALNGEPGLAPTLFMRGIVRTRSGDQAGREDIAKALRMNPSLERTYARYGIQIPKS